jgi:SAM-dependent methyltransferase
VASKPSIASWEDSVRSFRSDAKNDAAVLDNYFDLPVARAAIRYAGSDEFRAISRVIGRGTGRVLDVGAGHGIASFALAGAGWTVIALDPDASAEVGVGAIRSLRDESLGGGRIEAVIASGERLPLRNDSVDLVFGRQVLHHLNDLDEGLREARRVLRPGGRALFVREHVADDEAQRSSFLRDHPLHHMYGGENAYPLDRYLAAFDEARLPVVQCWGPLDSMINFYPGSRMRRLASVAIRLARQRAWQGFFDREHRSTALNAYAREPGRLYTFLACAA